MILLLDTSTPVCKLGVSTEDGAIIWHEWEANRELAHGLLRYITDILETKNMKISDIAGIGAYQGPGSFTGLRIGLTVMNTLAESLGVPIVGTTGDEWSAEAQRALSAGRNDRIVLPEYGSEANITKPRK